MSEWTDEARAEFDRWSKRRIRGEGVEASVARNRMLALVEAELAQGAQPVEVGELRTALARATFVGHARELDVGPDRRTVLDFRLFVLAGVLPALAVLVEIVSRVCASYYVDLFPTLLHWALGLSAPIAATAAWRFVRAPSPGPRATWLDLWLGTVIPFTLLTFVVFAPITWLAVMAFSFHPAIFTLVPIACMPAQLLLASRLVTTSSDDERTRRALWRGVALGASLLVVAELVAIASGATPVASSVLRALAHWAQRL